MKAGVAKIDVTPPAGLLMSGFAARTLPAEGTHDPLTVRAIAVDDTALAVVDVLGFDADFSAHVRARCKLPAERVVLTALHNHGGPVTIAGLRDGVNAAYLQRLEDACVAAIDDAVAAQQPATLTIGMGGDPDVARNRRHTEGITEPALPVLRVRSADGRMLAVLTSYACHPVVLGADNRLWTADYPHFVRVAIEEAHPGALAIFATGCCGDANTGHSAYASQRLGASADRSFETAERLGRRIAAKALVAPEQPLQQTVHATDCMVDLNFERREQRSLPELADAWRAEASADPTRKVLLDHWIKWADQWAAVPTPDNWPARVSVLDWGGLPLVALPGEIFAETSCSLRSALHQRPAFILSYADSDPGYIPPRSEFPFGGYEVDEAHRYMGMPASFAPGSAEALADAAGDCLRKLNFNLA